MRDLRAERYVQHGFSSDGRSVIYRHTETGQTVAITLNQRGAAWVNPLWGRGRLESEMRDRGYRLERSTRGEGGLLYRNSRTGEEVRIMPRPTETFRDEPIEKHLNSHYFRYRTGPDQPWGPHYNN